MSLNVLFRKFPSTSTSFCYSQFHHGCTNSTIMNFFFFFLYIYLASYWLCRFACLSVNQNKRAKNCGFLCGRKKLSMWACDLMPYIFIGYFTVGECVWFLFTSCVKQTNERYTYIYTQARTHTHRHQQKTVILFIQQILRPRRPSISKSTRRMRKPVHSTLRTNHN